jgi:hypothetical protein
MPELQLEQRRRENEGNAMKHLPLTIAVLSIGLTAAQAGQVNNRPTLSGTQTMQPATTTSTTARSSTSPSFFQNAVSGKHLKKVILH